MKTMSISIYNLKGISIKSLIVMLGLTTSFRTRDPILAYHGTEATRVNKDAKKIKITSLTSPGTTRSATTGSILKESQMLPILRMLATMSLPTS